MIPAKDALERLREMGAAAEQTTSSIEQLLFQGDDSASVVTEAVATETEKPYRGIRPIVLDVSIVADKGPIRLALDRAAEANKLTISTNVNAFRERCEAPDGARQRAETSTSRARNTSAKGGSSTLTPH